MCGKNGSFTLWSKVIACLIIDEYHLSSQVVILYGSTTNEFILFKFSKPLLK
jgi:hypothetical protein